MVGRMSKLRCFSWMVLILLLSAMCSAQENPLDPSTPNAPIRQVVFEFNWRLVDPQWYQISVEPTGRATYESKPQTKEGETPGDPYILRFIASEPTRVKIFELARALNYFRGNFESKYKVARTGDKTLTYRDGDKQSKTTLNYSDNPQMNQMIDIFQKMSTTFEMSRKLDYDLRFDKLGLDHDLGSMEDMNKSHNLLELQVIAPTLERIANDSAVMNISRQRARRLLNGTQSTGGNRQAVRGAPLN